MTATLWERISERGQEMTRLQNEISDMALTEISRQILAEYPDAEEFVFEVWEAEANWINLYESEVRGGNPYGEYEGFHWIDKRAELAGDVWENETFDFMRRQWIIDHGERMPITIDLRKQAAKYADKD